MSTPELYPQFPETPNLKYLSEIRDDIMKQEHKGIQDSTYIGYQAEEYIKNMAQMHTLYENTQMKLITDPKKWPQGDACGTVEQYIREIAYESIFVQIITSLTNDEFPLTVTIYTPLSFMKGEEAIVREEIYLSHNQWKAKSCTIKNGRPILSSPERSSDKFKFSDTREVVRTLTAALSPYVAGKA